MSFVKTIIIILLICSISDINYSQYKNHLTTKQNSLLLIDSSKKVQKLTEKEPALAGFLSFIAPGLALGQLYNGEDGKFLTHAIIGVTCLTAFIVSARFALEKLSVRGGTSEDDNNKGNSNLAGGIMFFSAVIFAGNYIITIADAIVSANNINKKVTLQKYLSESPGKIQFGFSSDRDKKLRLNFAINL